MYREIHREELTTAAPSVDVQFVHQTAKPLVGMPSAWRESMFIRSLLVLTFLSFAAPIPRALAQDLSPASVAQQSIEAEEATNAVSAEARARRTRPGYGVAAGLGLVVSGLFVASLARPNDEWGNLCYADPKSERGLLRVSTGVMVSGLVLAGGMLVKLLRVRAEHPELQPSRRARWGQALVGFGVASVMSTAIMSFTVGCSSS